MGVGREKKGAIVTTDITIRKGCGVAHRSIVSCSLHFQMPRAIAPLVNLAKCAPVMISRAAIRDDAKQDW